MRAITNQIKSLRFSLVIIFWISLLILGAVFGFHTIEGVELNLLTNDIASIANLPPYVGVQSQIGIFIWASAAAICFFSLPFVKNRECKSFLLFSGLFTAFLGFDDIFMFHEAVFPSLGIPQKVVFLGYALIMLLYVLKFLKVILIKTDYLMLGFACFWFGLSLFVDNFMYDYSPLITKLLEDGAKLIGIITWLVYFGRTCRQMINKDLLKSP